MSEAEPQAAKSKIPSLVDCFLFLEMTRRLERTLIPILAVVLGLITAHRLPAPISEEATPTPVPKSQQPKSAIKAPVRKAATMAVAQEVRVVLSDSARSTLQYLKNYVETYEHMPFAGKSDVQADEILAGLRQVLSNRFRYVSIANDGSAGRTAKGGLTMVLDLQAHIAGFSGQKTTISISGTFKDDSGRVLQTISAAGAHTMPYPAFSTRFHEAVAAAIADFSQKLGAAKAATNTATR